MAKIVRLTESELVRLVKKIIKEDNPPTQGYTDKTGYHNAGITNSLNYQAKRYSKEVEKKKADDRQQQNKKKELDNKYVKYIDNLFSRKEMKTINQMQGLIVREIQNLASKYGIKNIQDIHVSQEGEKGIILAIAKVDNYNYKILKDDYNLLKMGNRFPTPIDVQKLYYFLSK